jgi:SAM-dependent methyltransferase
VQVELLEQLVCPYCDAGFEIARAVARNSERLDYGLVQCRCFAFPVVDGILLLSLAKGYGGAEEELQPYVPLQVAAVHYLERDDVAGLRSWISRHAPLAAELIDGTTEPYLTFAARLDRQLAVEVRRFLDAYGRYEVLGYQGVVSRRTVGGALRSLLRRWRGPAGESAAESSFPTPDDYYAARYFSPRVNALALQFAALPPARRVLSLCCGHGVFENLVKARGQRPAMVSLDGQFLNLLLTRRFADHGGSYICHDVQFPLPFRSATFDGVFSSTCLPEIPAQRTFASEAIRVTSEQGWTDFDSIWNTENGARRIDTYRHYRFCQNFFTSLDDYVPMFEACAGPDRRVAVDVPDTPASYLTGPRWAFGADVGPTLASRGDYEISVLVLGRDFPGFVEPDRGWLRAGNLGISFAFATSRQGDNVELRRRPEFDVLTPTFAPRQFGGYEPAATIDLTRVHDSAYLTSLFTAAQVSLVPRDFTDDLSRPLGAAPSAAAREPAARETIG